MDHKQEIKIRADKLVIEKLRDHYSELCKQGFFAKTDADFRGLDEYTTWMNIAISAMEVGIDLISDLLKNSRTI